MDDKYTEMLVDLTQLEDRINTLKNKINEMAKERDFQEDRVKGKKEELEFIFENSAAAMVLTDEKGRWIKFNRAAEEFLGYQREEVLGKTTFENEKLLTPDTIPQLKKLWGDVIEKRERAVKWVEVPWRKKDGSIVIHLATEMPYLKREGRLYTSIDVTELQKKTRELQEKDKKMEECKALCGNVLTEVTNKGDISARIDLNRVCVEYLPICKDVNLILDNLQDQIGEILKREQEIKNEKIKFETMIDNSFDMIALLDNENRHLVVNSAFERITGYEAERIKGRAAPELPYITLESLKNMEPVWERIKRGEVVHPFDLPLKHRDGREVIVSGAEVPLKDISGNVIGRVFNARDVTELRKREEKIKEINAIDKFIFANLPDAYMLTDKEWRVLKVNKAFEEITGYKKEEVIGKTSYEFPAEYKRGRNSLWGDEDELKRMTELCAKTPPGGVIHEITQWRTKHGEPRTIYLTEIFLPEKISKTGGWVAIAKDLTELHKKIT